MGFQVLENKRKPIRTQTFSMDNSLQDANSLLKYWRFEQRGIIGDSLRIFMVFVDNLTQQIYIEEIDGSNLKFISNDDLFQELFIFAEKHKMTDILIPMVK